MSKQEGVEESVYSKSARGKTVNMSLELSEVQLEILQFLAEYKFATTGQLERYAGITRAAEKLRKLEEANLVRSYRYQPYNGRHSEKCWWLWYGGAKLLNTRYGLKVRYDPRLATTNAPSADRIHFRTMELELPCQVAQASGGWELILPQEFNRANPKDEAQPTPQTAQLARLLNLKQQRKIGEARYQGLELEVARLELAYKERDHLNCLPFHVNHHLAYLPDTEYAMLLILVPLDASSQFWHKRVAEYEELVARLDVYGVFFEANQARACKEVINTAGINALTINRVQELLDGFIQSL